MKLRHPCFLFKLFSITFLSFCLPNTQPYAQSSNDKINLGWFQSSLGEAAETYSWQKNPNFLEVLAYDVGAYSFDLRQFRCDPDPTSQYLQPATIPACGGGATYMTGPRSNVRYSTHKVLNPKCAEYKACSKARMERCPRPIGPTGGVDIAGSNSFINRFSSYAYCQTTPNADELYGSVSTEIQTTELYKNKIVTATGTKAYLQDSYTMLPRAIRRQSLATLKHIWANMGKLTCTDYTARANIVTKRNVAAPAVFYDCAYRDPSIAAQLPPGDTTQSSPFVPRDRDAWGPTQQCIAQSRIFFTGTHCTGQALAFFPMAKKDLSFMRVRDTTKLEEMVVSTDPRSGIAFDAGTLGLLSAIQKTAFFSEIFDRTMYFTYTDGEVYRRTVKYIDDNTADPNESNLNEVDSPYIQAYYRFPNPTTPTGAGGILSYYDYGVAASGAIVSNSRCRDATISLFKPGVPIPRPAPNGLGYYGYLDRVPGAPTHYSGLIVRQFRNTELDPVKDLAGDPVKIKAAVRNEYTFVGLDEAGCSADIAKCYPMKRSGPSRALTQNLLQANTDACLQASAPSLCSTLAVDVISKPNVIREWWYPDTFGDKTGLFQALTCSEGEYLFSLGRNPIDYGNGTVAKFDTSLPASAIEPNRFCLRYLLSRQPRKDKTGKDVLGDAGNPLPDMSFLAQGAVGGAMACDSDPIVMKVAANSTPGVYRIIDPGIPAVLTPTPPGRAFGTYTGSSNLVNYATLATSAPSNNAIDALNAMTSPKTIPATTYFNAAPPSSTNTLSIISRSVGLGDPLNSDPMVNLPANHGFCASTKLMPEHPTNSMGILAVPFRNYVGSLMQFNAYNDLGNSVFPVGTPPNCP